MTDENPKKVSKIDVAYTALAQLRKNGVKTPSQVQISELTGISRTTLGSKLDKWVKFEEDRKGGVSAPITEAQVELTKTETWQRNLKGVRERLARSEEALKELRDRSDTTFDALLEQLHQYFILTAKTPKAIQEEAKLRQEHAQNLSRLRYLEAAVEKLNSEKALPDNVRPLTRKEVIDVIPMELRRQRLDDRTLFDRHVDAVFQLNDYFGREDGNRPIAVYAMCGLPAAGKSSWIKNHRPPTCGVSVYLDGPYHTRAMRSVLVRHVRNLNKTVQIICCRVITDLERCLVANTDEERRRLGLSMDETVIRQVATAFEEVAFDEDFDAIIPVSL
jgi:hypothetical protein